MRRLLAVLVIASVSVACQASVAVTSPASTAIRLPSPSTSTHARMDLQMIVPPGLDGAYPPDLVVTCPFGQSFPVGALEEIAPTTSNRELLADIVSSPEAELWPEEYKDDWLLLSQDADTAVLVTRGELLGFINLEKIGDEWVWTGAQFAGGPCPLMFSAPQGLHAVDWRLDPASPPLGPGDDTVAVLMHERGCVSGIGIGDRLVGPQIVMTDSQVFVGLAATPPNVKMVTCQGNPETPFLVYLGEPLGDRQLVEGLDTGLNLEDYLD